jgi:Lon protease-like protein
MLKACPESYAARKAAIEQEERDAQLDTPIFVCTLAFPGVPLNMHIFEPRYRLMLRRCLGSSCPSFGMTLPPQAGIASYASDYGTMCEIHKVEMLADGRSLVYTVGSYRFRILARGTLDGYTVAKIERYVRLFDS